MKFAILIAAVLDEETIKESVAKIKTNIIDANSDIDFKLFITLDNHQRKDDIGTMDSINKLYNDISSAKCEIDFTFQEERLGQPLAMRFLYERFIKSRIKHCLTIDDDMAPQQPIKLKPFIEYQKNNPNTMIFLSTGNGNYPECPKKVTDKDTMFPLLNSKILLKNEFALYKLHTPKGNSFINNGAMLNREQVKKIFKIYNKDKHGQNNEDQISVMPFFKNKTKIMLGAKYIECDCETLPRNSVLFMDTIRFKRPRVHWNG